MARCMVQLLLCETLRVRVSYATVIMISTLLKDSSDGSVAALIYKACRERRIKGEDTSPHIVENFR